MTGDRPAPERERDDRKARQAAALRDNLHRRKAQLRARREEEPAAADTETPLAPDPPPG